MFKFTILTAFFLLISACKSTKTEDHPLKPEFEFNIAFGSCNKHDIKNLLWDDIKNAHPDVWIWGGDNIYADTNDVSVIASMYKAQNSVAGYRKLKSATQVIGTWDDHDYGLNDGGVEWEIKKESQQAFLDFLEIPESSPRRLQEGVYTSHVARMPLGDVKVIVLDTRYFRTALTADPSGEKRYIPNPYGQGTILGERQWSWLNDELKNSTAQFNIVVSSIQFLSAEHGYETWGNFPQEVDRLKNLIAESGASGVIILSGDRHLSEFSRTKVPGLSYPLIDFTSSGLTHAYREFSGEPNPHRLGEVVHTESFGMLRLSLSKKIAFFQIVGDGGEILGEIEQQY